MKERFGAKKAESMKLRTHAQTAGVSLTAQQPYNNVVRVALQALAAVLGGTQSLHTNSLDETYALPTEEAVTIALRTQQIIADESGVANTIDPLGGSYFVEELTEPARGRSARVHPPHRRDGRDGRARSRRATRSARSPRARTASSASSKRGERVMVGVNKYATERRQGREHPAAPHRRRGRRSAKSANLHAVKAERDAKRVKAGLDAVRAAAKDKTNLMPPIIEAAKAYARSRRSATSSARCSARTPIRPSSDWTTRIARASQSSPRRRGAIAYEPPAAQRGFPAVIGWYRALALNRRSPMAPAWGRSREAHPHGGSELLGRAHVRERTVI